jgi:hypothetical protein
MRMLHERADSLGSVLLDDVKSWTTVGGRDPIEIVERPIEMALSRPFEVADGGVVVGPVLQQKIAPLEEGGGASCRHRAFRQNVACRVIDCERWRVGNTRSMNAGLQ